MKKFLSMALIGLISFSAFTQSSEMVLVWSRVEALSKAIFETKDGAALEDLVSTKVTYGHSGGVIEDKDMMIRKAASNQTIYKNIIFERGTAEVDGKVAIVRHNFRATSVENNTETPLNLAILQVWRKEKGKWRIWARQAVKILPKD